jgi:transcriptional regulator with XRE-family HTH domain
MERAALAEFLRSRREKLQPEDVGFTRGGRRRTSGLRREEVAAAAGMSTDYYARMERGQSPKPSEQMVAALARGLRLTLEERDYLFRLSGYDAPHRARRTDHVDAGLIRVMDRLDDTPAAIFTSLGETLLQTRMGVALLGDQTRYSGLARSVVHRWFTEPQERNIYPADEHPRHTRVLVSQLRAVRQREGTRSRATELIDTLEEVSAEFREVWKEHPVGWRFSEQKRLVHPSLGELSLYCQSLFDLDQSQTLLVFTASPGSESSQKLELLSVVGSQSLGS